MGLSRYLTHLLQAWQTLILYRDVGHSWFCVPELPRSRYIRNAGTQECKFYRGPRERETRNAKRERIGMLNSCSCEEMTQLLRLLRGEVEGEDCYGQV